MAIAAEIVSQLRRELGGIHNRTVYFLWPKLTAGLRRHIAHMQLASAMADFATDRQFCEAKRRLFVHSVAFGHRLGLSVVANQASDANLARESNIVDVIARRQFPLSRVRVIRKWSLEHP